MRRSLFLRYFSICAAMILSCIIILGVFFLVFASQYFKEDKYKLLSKNANLAASLTLNSYYANNREYVSPDDVLPGYIILANSIDADIYLSDLSGQTILCTHKSACNHTANTISQDIIKRAKAGEYREIGKLSGIYSDQYFTVGLPIVTDAGQVVGVMFASTSPESLNTFLLEMLKIFLLSSVTVMSIAFIVIYFVTNNLVRPLREMVKATQSFSKGDFTIRVPVDGNDDEINKLALSFNNMASSLATLESVRRSFVANVSHELKTPMTTIGGFVDGILDGTIPPEKHKQYLAIISDEVKRLSRLVRSMLNIARIEAGEMQIKPEVFDVTQTVISTVFTFEQAIENKNIEIRGLDADKYFVEADQDLIHQVIYNLVDNAVKFVNEGGYIEFGYHVEGPMTYISVKNSGAGISKHEIAHVFDRFYKSDKSRSLDKNGVGLGLHIVRSIVNLHSGEIIVRSIEGEYCEFVFTLPTHTTKNSQNLFKKIDKLK